MSVPRDERLSAARVASHLVVMVVVAAIMGVIAAGLAIPFVGVLGVGARQVAQTMDNLPAELQTDPLPQKTKLLDADGDTIATLYDQNRVNVSLSQVSRIMVKSIIAIEDSRYYEHGALDLKGTLRALITNQANDGVVQGGSSITQQMVKMTLLTQADTRAERNAATDDTYARKLRELRYAIAFEQKFSKDWILERYLNIAYFGDGSYGVQSAARHYFNTNAKNLTLRQSAMLAGLVKNPSGYDPTNSPDRALERRNVVLDRMAELSVITREKAAQGQGVGPRPRREAGQERLPLLGGAVLLRLRPQLAAHRPGSRRHRRGASQQAQDRWPDDPHDHRPRRPGGGRRRRRRRRLQGRSGGRRDRDGRARHRRGEGARPVPADGPQRGGRADVPQLHRADPRTAAPPASRRARRSRRSCWRPRSTTTSRCRRSFERSGGMTIPQDEFENCPGEPGFAGEWEVATSTTSGPMDIYRGTQTSSNTFYAMLERETGVCEPFRIAKEIGVDLTDPKGDSQGYGAERVPTFTLGVANASPLEMAEAYATFAARGMHCKSQPVTEIQDSAGTLLKEYPPSCTQVLPQGDR